MRKCWLLLGIALSFPLSTKWRGGQGVRVDVVPHADQRRVDVLVDGKPFTSYIYPTTLKKPTLYPVRAASGVVVTRGWPLEPRPGERVDHPHQVGLWFDHGDVNGLDFWNNSNAIPAERAPKMGTIVHRAVRHAESGSGPIDRITTLTAVNGPVTFIDNKEGLIGMRVARALEQPSTTPEVFTDAGGHSTTVPRLDNTGVTGHYRSSEGIEGDSVWGTRA